jgi:hypothetical protein
MSFRQANVPVVFVRLPNVAADLSGLRPNIVSVIEKIFNLVRRMQSSCILVFAKNKENPVKNQSEESR